MEPVGAPVRYVYVTVCKNMYELIVPKYVSGSKENTVFSTESLGWYVNIDDEFALYVGMDKPDIEIGDKLRLTLEGVEK